MACQPISLKEGRRQKAEPRTAFGSWKGANTVSGVYQGHLGLNAPALDPNKLPPRDDQDTAPFCVLHSAFCILPCSAAAGRQGQAKAMTRGRQDLSSACRPRSRRRFFSAVVCGGGANRVGQRPRRLLLRTEN